MVELAVVSAEVRGAAEVLCDGERATGLPARTPFDGGCMLAFLRVGVMSFQVMAPSALDSKRPSPEEAHPWVASLKSRLTSPALDCVCGPPWLRGPRLGDFSRKPEFQEGESCLTRKFRCKSLGIHSRKCKNAVFTQIRPALQVPSATRVPC
jgi:hypothetical protein